MGELDHYTCGCGTEVWRQPSTRPALCLECEATSCFGICPECEETELLDGEALCEECMENARDWASELAEDDRRFHGD